MPTSKPPYESESPITHQQIDQETSTSSTLEDQVALSPKNMQQQNASHWRKVLGIASMLSCFAIGSIWTMQNSVNAYFLQTYHQPSPLTCFDHIPAWTYGGKVGDTLYDYHRQLTGTIQQANQQIVDKFNAQYAFTPQFLIEQAEQKRLRDLEAKRLQEETQHKTLLSRYTLSKNDQIFFAGDSMMQGVAPIVQKHLKENHNINSINLSKQSTGLSYPSFFNWPKTIKDTLAAHSNIKILVVFLGPNDPWDMPNPNGGTYLKFRSPEWETVYRSRIAEILQTAQQHQVEVIWISPPNMKKTQLNEQMMYLNTVMQDEVTRHNALFIDSRGLVGGENNVYNDYLVKDGQSIKMRSTDGIHFSPQGQKLMAEVIQQQLTILTE